MYKIMQVESYDLQDFLEAMYSVAGCRVILSANTFMGVMISDRSATWWTLLARTSLECTDREPINDNQISK